MNSFPALNIISGECLPFQLDFRMDVVHSLASRYHTLNVCVVLESETGFFGFGECVPRSYVTGETPEGVLKVLNEMMPVVRGKILSSPEDVISLLKNMGATDIGTRNPAAICAMELALLDLAGKHWDVSVSVLLGMERTNKPLTYSLVVPLLPNGDLETFLEHAGSFHFNHAKVKVDSHNPAGRVQTVKAMLGTDVEIRVDANCSWNHADAVVFIKKLADLGVVSLEQPFTVDDLQGMADLRRAGMIPITLDESVRSAQDVDVAASAGACDIINVRVSKCGGLLGVLQVIEAAWRNGLEIQLGAHVGESCILSAAGALLAAGIPSFKWLEGFFGTHLLVKDLCRTDIRFGQFGRLDPPSGPGLGVLVDRELLKESRTRYEKSVCAKKPNTRP